MSFRNSVMTLLAVVSLAVFASPLLADEGWTPAGGSDGIIVFTRLDNARTINPYAARIEVKFVNKQRKGKYAKVEYQVRAEAVPGGMAGTAWRDWSSGFGVIVRIAPNTESTDTFTIGWNDTGGTSLKARNPKVDIISVTYSDRYPN